MRTFTKQQLTAWLNVMSSDTTRPALCGVAFKDDALVMTDGYALVALDIKDEWDKRYEPEDEINDREYIVPREKIKEWCKLHSAKATITVKELFEMASNHIGRYPEWRQLLPKVSDTIEPTQHFNMRLIEAVTQVFKNQTADMTMFDANSPIQFKTKDTNDLALVMPMKK